MQLLRHRRSANVLFAALTLSLIVDALAKLGIVVGFCQTLVL
jgi:hypothetical protein